MAMQRCENGHAFDDTKYTSCPYCGIKDFEPGRTQAKRPNKAQGNTQRQGPKKGEDKTRARPGVGGSSNRSGEENRTVGVMFKKKGVDPVVGWLVCVKGPEKGRDYRIQSGRNTIGRSRKMDVCVAGDDSISRENHASLAYDRKANRFTLVPGEGRELVYLNGEALYQPSQLGHHDEIELGETKLHFVPFCDEKFHW